MTMKPKIILALEESGIPIKEEEMSKSKIKDMKIFSSLLKNNLHQLGA